MKVQNIFNALLSLAIAFFAFTLNSCKSENEEAKVKNIIMLIGDGMGPTHIPSLILEEQFSQTNFQRAKRAAFVTTYSSNNRVTDSAAAGTALACGEKTNNSVIGLNADGDTIYSNITLAESLGMETAIVVSCDITHATPAAFYAHAAHRDEREAIASWLPKSGVDVIFGGGMSAFTQRSDSINLIEQFRNNGYYIASSLTETDSVSEGKVIGLFAEKHLPSAVEGRGDALPKATAKALEILTNNCKKNDCGFFIMVEGSQIDFESHANNAKGIYAEMKDFDAVVGLAFDYADSHPGTLVIVCADHDTGGMSIPSCKTDFTLGESGVEYNFGSTSHTATMTPALFYGTGADNFGAIIDNTDIAKKVSELLQNSF